MAALYGSLEGSKSTATRTGTEVLRARLATWHAAVVVDLDCYGTWTVHVEPADPQEAAQEVPVILCRGNLHTGQHPGYAGPTARRPARSPDRRPPANWAPFTTP